MDRAPAGDSLVAADNPGVVDIQLAQDTRVDHIAADSLAAVAGTLGDNPAARRKVVRDGVEHIAVGAAEVLAVGVATRPAADATWFRSSHSVPCALVALSCWRQRRTTSSMTDN